MDWPADALGVPLMGSHPWRAWWLGAKDRGVRQPRSIDEILSYFRLADFPLPASERAKLETRYAEGFWQLVDRSGEQNGPNPRR